MSAPGRIAVVTRHPERKSRAASWGELLAGRADYHLCESPAEPSARSADLVVVDEDDPDLREWIEGEAASERPPESIVRFGNRRSQDGALAWGREGTDVLATISDYLERRELLLEADEFLDELRESNQRLEGHRRRLARLALDQADALRGANATLAREVDELTRLQELARFFAAPGSDESFSDRLAGVAARAVGACGAALCRPKGKAWSVEGRWRISRRNALGMAPDPGPDTSRSAPQPSTRKGRVGWWLPIEETSGVGLALLFREGREPSDGAFLDSVRAIVAEGLETRAETQSLLFRKSQSDRILRTLRGGLLKIDGQGRIALANPACAEILETTVDRLEGARLDEAFPEHVREILQSVSAGKGTLDDVETFLHTASGRHVSVSIRASALHGGEAGDEILVLLSDLSRRKEVEEEVRKVDRLAALGRLSAGVAHEIRNPLAGIRTTAEILRGRISDGDDRGRFVDVILEETARLDRIVGSLLQFAKPPEPRLRPLAVYALLDRARELAAGRAADRGVTVRVGERTELPCPLADHDQILQVVLNLILNAIEATPEGGSVRALARATPDGAQVRLTVEDEGPGVAPAMRERIFDPFFTTKPGGTGLGLSISQNIVARHGGSLRIESAAPGSRITVFLPVQAAGDGGATWPTS